MENIARLKSPQVHASIHEEECEVIELRSGHDEADSRIANFVDEIDAWARHALSANGFGDY